MRAEEAISKERIQQLEKIFGSLNTIANSSLTVCEAMDISKQIDRAFGGEKDKKPLVFMDLDRILKKNKEENLKKEEVKDAEVKDSESEKRFELNEISLTALFNLAFSKAPGPNVRSKNAPLVQASFARLAILEMCFNNSPPQSFISKTILNLFNQEFGDTQKGRICRLCYSGPFADCAIKMKDAMNEVDCLNSSPSLNNAPSMRGGISSKASDALQGAKSYFRNRTNSLPNFFKAQSNSVELGSTEPQDKKPTKEEALRKTLAPLIKEIRGKILEYNNREPFWGLIHGPSSYRSKDKALHLGKVLHVAEQNIESLDLAENLWSSEQIVKSTFLNTRHTITGCEEKVSIIEALRANRYRWWLFQTQVADGARAYVGDAGHSASEQSPILTVPSGDYPRGR